MNPNKEAIADIRSAINVAADSLGRSLEHFSYPNGGRDAPFHESNVVIHFGTALQALSRPFHVFAEAAIGGRGHIDLIASRDDVALLVEAKTFGDLTKKAKEAHQDIHRMRRFQPSPSPIKKALVHDWYRNASTRLGLLLVGSHCSADFNLDWDHQGSEERANTAMNALFSDLADLCAVSGHRLISRCSDWLTDDSGDAYLLWSLFDLPNHESCRLTHDS